MPPRTIHLHKLTRYPDIVKKEFSIQYAQTGAHPPLSIKKLERSE